jgi:hypothetical protein
MPFEKGGSQQFKGLLDRVKERLETFANVNVVKLGRDDEGFGVRMPREWSPVGVDENLDRGYWIFPEFNTPIMFRFHLPKKIQKTYCPIDDEEGVAEDFVVVYDGMTFTAAANTGMAGMQFWTPPLIRKYLQKELLAGIGDFKPAIIPPSPMHIGIERISHEAAAGNEQARAQDHYDLTASRIVVERWEKVPPPMEELTAYLHLKLKRPIRRFYHLMLDKDVVDDVYREIRATSQQIFDNYFALLETSWWSIIKRARTKQELSLSLADLQREFCEHSISLAQLQEAREALKRDLPQYHPLSTAEEYFDRMGKPDEVNYEVFHSTLEHIRSHLLVLVQNRYLILAAVVGSLLTLLATYLPKLLYFAQKTTR